MFAAVTFTLNLYIVAPLNEARNKRQVMKKTMNIFVFVDLILIIAPLNNIIRRVLLRLFNNEDPFQFFDIPSAIAKFYLRSVINVKFFKRFKQISIR